MGCPALLANSALGAGTVHNASINQNETWTLADSPHRFPDGITIGDGIVVTLAPCSVVLVGHGGQLAVDAGGTLIAVGDATHPVRLGSDNPTPQPGDWRGLHFDVGARASSQLVHVIIEHAGAGDDDTNACVVSELVGLDARNVTARACRGYGVALEGHGSFAQAATGLRVTGTVAAGARNTGAVAISDAEAVRTLPAGMYTGNATDEVFIHSGSDRTVRTTATWSNPGVRYHVADDLELRVEGSNAPVLTIAPGTTVAMGRNAALFVGWEAEGGLIADGLAEATRIVFAPAGSDPSPGNWQGIVLGERYNRTRSRLNFATIAYAGSATNIPVCDWTGENSDHALLYIHATPSPQLVQHVRFAGAPADGAAIARNWSGASVDFASAGFQNDFSNAGTQCKQSPVQGPGGACVDERRCD